MAGAASQEDAAELAAFARELRGDVMEWLRNNHPHLLPEPKN